MPDQQASDVTKFIIADEAKLPAPAKPDTAKPVASGDKPAASATPPASTASK